jgi:hypothetical protein
MKNILILSALIALALNGCGGSSDSSYSGTHTLNGTKHECKSESSYNACKDGDCSSCTYISGPEPTTPPSEDTNATCEMSGNTVSANEGQTCTHEDHTISCQGGKVTLDDSITASSISINGTNYICK